MVEDNMTSKKAFLVDTPLQLYNSISCAFDNKWEKETDIYILPQFNDAERIIKVLKESNVFNSIYEVPLEERFKIVKLNLLYAVLMPNIYVKSKIGINMKEKKYEKIFLAQPTRLFDTMVSASGCNSVCGLEDGMGSYCRKIYDELTTKKYRLIRKIFRKTYKVESLYLHAPKYYVVNEISDVCKIDSNFNDEQKKLINNIFGDYRFDEYDKYKVIYSNQPMMDFSPEHEKVENEVMECLKKIRDDNVIIRLHPREKKSELYNSFHIDQNTCLWEVFCNNFNEQHVLMGCFSTTQFTPKLFYDKEPVVIFTYDLYKDIPNERRRQFDVMVDELCEKYKRKENVINVKSFDDLQKVLKSIS